MKITAEFDPKELKQLGKDIDELFLEMGKELSSVRKMKPMVDKIKQGMKENAMKFENSEHWEKTKKAMKGKAGVKATNPIMTTGQLVGDFKFEKETVGVRKATKDEFIIGGFTWSDKIRERPTYEHILNQLAIKEGGTSIYEDAKESSFMKSSDLVKIIMRSPRYPIMDSIMTLYQVDIQLHMEKAINEAFKKKP